MFAAPPKFSEEDLRLGEAQAYFTMQQFVATSAALFLSPFIVDVFWKVF